MTHPQEAARDMGPDPDDLALAAGLRLVVGRLYRRYRRNLEGNLTPAEISIMATVEEYGPIRPGELASREGVKPPTLTKGLTALERRGLVDRRADPADGRAMLVQLTPDGAELLDSLRVQRTADFADRLSRLSPEEKRLLSQALPLLESMLR